MQNGYVEKRIKKSGWKLILLGIAGIIFITLIGLISSSYYYEFFRGPVAVTGNEIQKYLQAGYFENGFISVKVDDLRDSGIYDSFTNEDGEEVIETRYYFAEIDDYVIIIEADPDGNGTEFAGEIFWLNSSAQDRFTKIFQNEGIEKFFIPIVLLKNDYRLRGYTGLALLGLVSFLTILSIVRGARFLHRLENHPSMREVARFGPVEFTSSRIDSEMAVPHEKISHTHFLTTMVLEETKYGFTVMRYADIVWVYKQNFVGKNLAIFQFSTYSLIIHDCFQKTLCLVKKQGQVDKIMVLLSSKIPYAYKGYTDELHNLWNTNPRAILQGVQDRKVAVNQSSEMPPLPTEQEQSQG